MWLHSRRHLHIYKAQSAEPIECDNAALASRVNHVRVILGFKIVIASKEALFPFCVGLFKAFSPRVTNRLNRVSSVLLTVTKNA